MVMELDPSNLAFPTAVISLLSMGFVFFMRERRLAHLRRRVEVIHALSEQILSARTPSEILDKIDAELAITLGSQRALIYAHNAEAGSLDAVVRTGGQAPARLPLPAEGQGTQPAARQAFEKSSPVALTDAGPPPRGVHCYPMFAQGGRTGVLQLEFEKTARKMQADETAALQHLANQAAIALKLMDQQFLREQILRGEKLAAAGELISGVAQELRAPLDMLAERAHRLAERVPDVTLLGEVRALAAETQKASDTLDRLMSFSRGEQSRARPVSLNRLLEDLLQFRAPQWRLKNIACTKALGAEDLVTVGAQGQLEQAFLSLLLHAEQSVEALPGERTIGVASHQRAGRAVIEIDYSAPAAIEADSRGGLGVWSLGVCNGIFENHGGTMQHRPGQTRSVFEIELPLAQAAALSAAGESSRQTRPLTVVVAEPEPTAQRHLVSLLASRNHRVVTASTATEALDYLQRVRFDALFAGARLPDMAWAELAERSRRHVSAFVVLTDGLEKAMPGETHLLHKPVVDAELDLVLTALSGPARPAS